MKRIPLFFICIFILITGFPKTTFGHKEPPFQLVDLNNNSLQFSLRGVGFRTLLSNFISDTYTVSVAASPSEGGTLSGSGIYNYGNNVTVNATPRQGFIFANWTENGTLVSTNSTYSFIINSNRTLVANFTAITYSISAVASPSDGGTLSGGGIYDYGATVLLNATPRAGYSFLYWTENGIQISENSFYNITVQANRTLVANFGLITYNGIISASAAPAIGGTVSGSGTYAYGSVATLAAIPNTGYNFTSWTESGTIVSTNPAYSFTVDGNRTLTANFTIRTHSVYVTASPADGGTATGGGTYNYGSIVNLNATPNAGYEFLSWTENGSRVSTSSTYSFTVNANRALVANFTNNTSYVVSATATPSAGGNVSGNGTYSFGSLVTMNASPVTGYRFVNWTENGMQVSTSSVYNFTINSNRTLVANFTPIIYSILTSVSPLTGGTVSGNGTYNNGSIASLTATSLTGYSFTNWTEGGTVVSTNPIYSFTVSGNRTLTANFKIITNTISVTASPTEGGSVSGGGTYNFGSSVTLTATPGNGYNFVNWTENGTQVSSSINYSFSINSNSTIVANFILKPNTSGILASATPASGGTVSGAGAYSNGSVATLTTTPNTGYSFTNWTEGGTIVSTNTTYSFTVTGSRTLNANFKISTNSLSVTALPTQGGIVSGSGIYDYGSVVTVNATPGTGYSFTGWTENGVVVSTSSTYSFTINTNRSLVANFVLNPNTSGILATAVPSAGGTVSGSSAYTNGTVATLIANPNPGYSFTNWTEGGTVVNTNSTYIFTVGGSRTLSANFTIITNTVLVAAVPIEGGTISGNGTYTYGSIVTLNAIPVTGYSFVNWTENGSQVSASSTYSFAVNSNRTFVANFTHDEYSILATAYPSTGGTVTGNAAYDYGSSATLKAIANTGYSFAGWTESGLLVSSDSIYSFIVTQNRTLLANYIVRTQRILVTASPAEGGSVSAGGTYNYGSVITLYIIPKMGYNFVNWTENGLQVSTSSTYSFTVYTDRILVANFTPVTYQVSASASPSMGGMVNGGKKYDYGSVATLTAKVNAGYSFTNWTEDGIIVSSDSIYSFIVEGSRSLIANFKIKTYTISATVSPAESGAVSGGGTYNYGSTITLNATPGIGYSFINWTENGTQISISSTYSFSIDADRILVANFSHNTSNNGIIQASVSPQAGGIVSGTGSFNYGSLATVTASANTGYSFTNWTEGGVVVSTNATYSFTVERNRTLIANFTINTYVISAAVSSNEGGFVSGGGTYNYGSVVILSATPNIGYSFGSWTEYGVIRSTNSSYSFTVESNRILVANFISTVGIENNSSKQIRMYPNPAHDILYFEFPTTEKTVVTIFDTSGQLVLTSFEKTISISNLPVGFYFVKVKEQAFKFVKQ